jgi:hypothetical protein
MTDDMLHRLGAAHGERERASAAEAARLAKEVRAAALK